MIMLACNPRGRSNLYEKSPISGAAIIRKFSRNQKSNAKSNFDFKHFASDCKNGSFYSKNYEKRLKTAIPPRFDFLILIQTEIKIFQKFKEFKERRYNESKIRRTTQRRYEDTKKQRKRSKNFMRIKEN